MIKCFHVVINMEEKNNISANLQLHLKVLANMSLTLISGTMHLMQNNYKKGKHEIKSVLVCFCKGK